MDSLIESYNKGNYEQVMQTLNSNPNKLIECKTLLKLNQFNSLIPLGPCMVKSQSENFQKAQQIVNELQGDDKEIVQTIIDFYQGKNIVEGKQDEQLLYYGLYLYERQEFDQALKMLMKIGDLQCKDDQKHKLLMIAECQIKLEQYKQAIKTLEFVGENSYCYSLLSQCYYKQNDQQQGQKWMNEAIKNNQGCFYAQLNQAKQTNIEQQIKIVNQFLEKDSNNIGLIREFINVQIMKGSNNTTKCMGEYACRPRGECIQNLLEYIQKLPKCNSTDFLQAQILYYNYKNQDAIQLFEQCLKNNYKEIECRYYIALIHKDMLKYKDCMIEFKQISQQTKGEIKDDCHFWRVVIYIELNELEQALKELEYIQSNAQNYTLISRLYYVKGNKIQADIWIKEALKLNSKCFFAQVEKESQQTKFECITLLEQLIKNDPYNLCAKQALVKFLIQHSENLIAYSWGEYSCKPKGKEIQRAIELLQQIKQVRDCIQLDYLEAICNYYLDNLQESEQHFQKCIDLNYQFWTSKYYISLIKKDQMKFQESLIISQQVLDHDDRYIQQCLANRAWIFIQLSQPDKAIKELEKSKHGCQYFVLLGQAYIMKGNSIQANIWFNESIKINPQCLYAKINQSILQQRQDEVLKLLENAQKQDPDNYVITWYRGKVNFRLNKFDIALQLFDKCIQQKHIIAYASKAKILRVQKKYEEALQILEQGLQIDNQLPPFLIVKASILYDQQKYEESIKICEQINDNKNVHYLRQKALALYNLNKKDEALKLYEEILNIDKFNIQAFIGKAQIIKENDEIYGLMNQLSEIVIQKKMYKATINPIVVQNCRDLLQLNQEFENKGGVIEKVISIGQNLDKQKLDFEQLKQQKEQICNEKILCIMNPICHIQQDITEDILKKLNILYKQMSELQQKQQTQLYEQLLNNPIFNQCTQDEQNIWDNIKKDDLIKQIQNWNQINQENNQNKYNYALVFYNLFLNHIKSYINILNDKLQDQEDYYKQLQLGNSFIILDDIIDNSFTMIKLIKYERRIKSFIKLIKENQLTNKCENNLQLIVALCAQSCADLIDFTKEVQQSQSHTFKYQTKFMQEQIDEFVNKSQIPEFQLLSGKYAIRDVLVIITYSQHNFIALISKAKQIPLHNQIALMPSKHQELSTESHPIHQNISAFNSNYGMKDYKSNPQRDKIQGDDGCCTIM